MKNKKPKGPPTGPISTKELKKILKKMGPVNIKLGDLVEKGTKATGINSLVKKVWGDDCGCEERKEILNNMFETEDEDSKENLDKK
tara:strand:+ start:910 stop:1167 length:258 start_codon:yes stop_codon:yes gene_type:complete